MGVGDLRLSSARVLLFTMGGKSGADPGFSFVNRPYPMGVVALGLKAITCLDFTMGEEKWAPPPGQLNY